MSSFFSRYQTRIVPLLGILCLLTVATLTGLNVSASADLPSFDAGTGIVRGAQQIAPLGGGKILAVSDADGTGTSLQLVRFNADGTVDGTFAPGDLALSSVASVTSLPAGQILIAGEVDSSDGTATTSQLLRLNFDGTLDATFNPGGAYADQPIVQPDGKILLLEQSYADDGSTLTALVRLNLDGSLDSQFTAAIAFDPARNYAIQIQSDGKLLVNSDGADDTPPTLVRLNADGSIDSTFAVLPLSAGSFTSILPLSDGKVAAAFSSSDGSVNTVLRFNTDGTVDLAFNSPDSFDGPVNTLFSVPGGALIAVGDFGSVDSATRNGLARFGPDGALDSAYDPLAVATGYVSEVLVGVAGDLFAAFVDVSQDSSSSATGNLIVDHFAPDGSLLGSLPVSDSFDCSLVATADGTGVYVVAADSAQNTLIPGVVMGGSSTTTTLVGGAFAPPPAPGVVIVRGRPVVTITAVQAKVYSGSAAPGKFLLRRTGKNASKPLRVVYSIGGTAVAGRDYRSLRRTRVIPAGQQTVEIVVRPVGKRFAAVELGYAKVTVTLAGRPTYRIGAHQAARIKIIDLNSLANHHG